MRTELEKILYSHVNPETKVYLIGRQLHECNQIPDTFWYAILELKNKHIHELQVKWGDDGPKIMEEKR